MINIEEFRQLLVRRECLFINQDLFLNEIDPKRLFYKNWVTGLPVSEVFSEYSTKEMLKVSKNIKKCYKYIETLSLESPRTWNPQNELFNYLGMFSERLFKVVSGITFEKPELYYELPETWKKGLDEYRRDYRDFKKVVQKVLTPFNDRSIDSIDRYTGKYDEIEVEKFINTEKEFYESLQIPSDKLLPEHVVLGWFKEFREHNSNSIWFEYFLKSISIPKYSVNDFILVLICAEIVEEKELESHSAEEIFDLFWDNVDEIYNRLFHDNIKDVPTYVTRVYISIFTTM
jgi:hypothetical protein